MKYFVVQLSLKGTETESRASNRLPCRDLFYSVHYKTHLFQISWIFTNFSPFYCLFAGEVERLLKEYRQNQELVRRIGGHYYQIIYPVQLRHHEKMGISTREVAKVRNRLRKRNTFDSTVCLFIFISSPPHKLYHCETQTNTRSDSSSICEASPFESPLQLTESKSIK